MGLLARFHACARRRLGARGIGVSEMAARSIAPVATRAPTGGQHRPHDGYALPCGVYVRGFDGGGSASCASSSGMLHAVPIVSYRRSNISVVSMGHSLAGSRSALHFALSMVPRYPITYRAPAIRATSSCAVDDALAGIPPVVHVRGGENHFAVPHLAQFNGDVVPLCNHMSPDAARMVGTQHASRRSPAWNVVYVHSRVRSELGEPDPADLLAGSRCHSCSCRHGLGRESHAASSKSFCRSLLC